MKQLFRKQLSTVHGEKSLSVLQGDIMTMTDKVDLLTISAFQKNYVPSYGTLIWALQKQKGICVEALAQTPDTDLRREGNCWISAALSQTECNRNIRRLGCIEFDWNAYRSAMTEQILRGIHGYYQMLDFFTTFHPDTQTVVMPLVGGGNQGIGEDRTALPLLREAVAFLQRNPYVKQVIFADLSERKAAYLAETAENSYIFDEQPQPAAVPQDCAFICHSSKDADIAELLTQRLNERGIRTWYAPESISKGAYAAAIVEGICTCTHFIVIVSKNSMRSEHVLNEIDLAFGRLQEGLWLLPFRVDEEQIRAEFKYYLSRQEWMFAAEPPLERQIRLFLDKVFPETKKADETEAFR